MPKRTDLKTILIIGAGPIVIGQACEFDYSGAQACKALRDEGYRVVLVNSNPATIMTDPEMADAVYIEPINWQTVEKIIAKEKPDALLPTMGGQTALNCALDLADNGVLEKYNVELIGAKREAIRMAEDRELFRVAMGEIGLECPTAAVAHTLDEALEIQTRVGYPTIIRPSFTLGGSGGGIAYNREELVEIVSRGLELSPTTEVLVEESVLGWKEFEMEVVRDTADNCIIVCSIENLDPMGVHTGDSITVAPAQTLTDKEYQRLRDASIAVLRKIGVDTGGSNVQFGINPKTGRVVVIEMNPRVSRSSALASKATGFPIAKVAAKLAVGYTLDELKNEITGGLTPASFEPSIDYVVTKIPRFAFEKFPAADARLTTQMKSVGEVMAMGRTFQESVQKALRGLETGKVGFDPTGLDLGNEDDLQTLRRELKAPGPERLFFVADAFRAGMSVEEIYALSFIDHWFLDQIEEIIAAEADVAAGGIDALDAARLRKLKRAGFSDARLAQLTGTNEAAIRALRRAHKVRPVYKRVDSCAGEFSTGTAYLYSTYEDECEAAPSNRDKIMILGGGPNRIGQGIEFDYCCVHASLALRAAGYETVMVNCNPETVSTDYDTSDRLYFEPLAEEDVLAVIAAEQEAGAGGVAGVILALGGQTPLKLAGRLPESLVLGTSASSIDLAEDREAWSALCARLEIPQPAGGTVRSIEEAREVVARVGYPVLVRPSYVLGGRAMEIVYDDDRLASAMAELAGFDAVSGGPAGSLGREGGLSAERPVLVDRFLEDAVEVDVDAIRDRTGEVLIGGVLEHVEEAGVHSGDSACALPPQTLSGETIAVIERYTREIAEALGVQGPLNVQYAVKLGQVFVIEANPRASRTVPFVAKATGIPLAKIAARVIVGATLDELRAEGMLAPDAGWSQTGQVSVKEAVLPFSRFPEVDALLGPEMRSTGEVMGIAPSFGLAFAKSQIAAGTPLPDGGTALFSLADRDKAQGVLAARALVDLGFGIAATEGTATFFAAEGVPVASVVEKVGSNGGRGRVELLDLVRSGEVTIVVNTPKGRGPRADGASIRHAASQADVPILTTVAAARAAAAGIAEWRRFGLSVKSLQEHHAAAGGGGAFPRQS